MYDAAETLLFVTNLFKYAFNQTIEPIVNI